MRIALIGMSGSGKTYWSKKLEETTHNYNIKKGHLIHLFDNQPKCFGFNCNSFE